MPGASLGRASTDWSRGCPTGSARWRWTNAATATPTSPRRATRWRRPATTWWRSSTRFDVAVGGPGGFLQRRLRRAAGGGEPAGPGDRAWCCSALTLGRCRCRTVVRGRGRRADGPGLRRAGCASRWPGSRCTSRCRGGTSTTGSVTVSGSRPTSGAATFDGPGRRPRRRPTLGPITAPHALVICGEPRRSRGRRPGGHSGRDPGRPDRRLRGHRAPGPLGAARTGSPPTSCGSSRPVLRPDLPTSHPRHRLEAWVRSPVGCAGASASGPMLTTSTRRDLRATYATVDCTPIDEAPDRERVRLRGTLRTVTLRPRGGVPAPGGRAVRRLRRGPAGLAGPAPDHRHLAGPLRSRSRAGSACTRGTGCSTTPATS